MSQFYQGTTAGSLPPSVPLQFTTDSGVAVPVANNINIVTPGGGTDGIQTSGSGSTITVTLTTDAVEYTSVDFAMSPYTALDTDYFISVDASGGPVIVNLPDNPGDNKQYVVKDRLGVASTNSITVKSLSGVTTIDTDPTVVFTDDFESLECLYNSGNYEVF